MALCPIDFEPCVDDICYGGGCIRCPYHSAMYSKCQGCGHYISDEDRDDCTCDDEFDDDGMAEGFEDESR